MGTFVMAQTQYSITFQVDMTDADPFDPATDEIFMSSSFAGWPQPGTCAGCVMEPTGVGSMIYTNTATIDSGEVQYKYFRVINGEASWDHGEWTGTDNRIVQLSEDVTFENIWANRPHIITFNVDMTNADPFDPATDDVYITGTLTLGHAWTQPGTISAYMMSPTEEGSMFYTIDLSLYHGHYDYKYFRIINGEASWDHGEPVASDRGVTVDTVAAVIDNIWGDISGIFGEPNLFTYNMYPNPVITLLNIDNTTDVNQVDIFDVTGKLIRTVQIEMAQSVSIDVAELNTGVYIVNVHNDKGMQASKFIKN
jgi:hypothetical protein